jgi:hypothetical protein
MGFEQDRTGLRGDHAETIDLDAVFGQQFLDVSIREAVAQVPADSDRDHLRREPEPGETRTARQRDGRLQDDAPAQLPQPSPTAAPGIDACKQTLG